MTSENRPNLKLLMTLSAIKQLLLDHNIDFQEMLNIGGGLLIMAIAGGAKAYQLDALQVFDQAVVHLREQLQTMPELEQV